MANFKYYNNKNKNDNGDWKRSKDENFHGGSKPRSYFTRKNSVNGRQLSNHQLEERFCSFVGGVSLQEVLQNQKYMYQHEKILEWKDSAVKETYWDAKNRFFATVHGQPCDIKLPDPDMFIDKIDWNSTIDPDLLSDLENWDCYGSGETDTQDGGVIVGIPSIINPSDFTQGWGEAEETNPQQKYYGGNEPWVDNSVKREETTFSHGWEDDYVYVSKNNTFDEENRDHGPTWSTYRNHPKNIERNRKGDHGGWGTSRYKISRYQHYSYGQPLRNHGVRRGSFSCERPVFTWKPVTR